MGEEVEQAILEHCLAHPCHGALRVANELALRSIQVSSTGVRGVWSRHGLLSRHDRLLRLEKASAERTVQLSDEQVEAPSNASAWSSASATSRPITAAICRPSIRSSSAT